MRSIIKILAALTIAACGAPVEDTAQPEAQDIETAFDPLVDNLGKAKELNDVALRHKDDMDASLQNMEEGADDAP